ncbi:MAG: transcriptional regulator [Chloroflexi bacterium HGW-Chloroflexi-9]|jgi:DNA-binding HxlR family transcriptional regulator|nr:helix-turn-helix domain-containing protein [Dehalococcoidia bacterium]PKN82251.1 MAG: transcriptional regulator [Chloroflexi bacterium HGW-Chloroflexi-9]
MDAKDARTPDGQYCPVRATLALLGQKWVPRIVYELRAGKRRFNDLAEGVGGCNSRTLRDRLKALEELGVVRREIVTTTPPWVEYELTERGRELAEALGPLATWGREHLADEALIAIVTHEEQRSR